MSIELTDEEKLWLKELVDHFEQEDMSVRNRQIRTWRKLKLLWEGFYKIWYSETAHDWRVWDEQQDNDSNQQDSYDKPVNVFRAYLESIIAALSVTVPGVKCYPDNADDPLDLLTAKAGDKIAELISRHNDVSLLWIHALFTYCTEGMVACYNYTKEDEEYGTYEEQQTEDTEENHRILNCPECNTQMDDITLENEEDEYDPSYTDLCETCKKPVNPIATDQKLTVTRIVGTINKPKARQCMEVYGGLYVKVANYAKRQCDTPYLGFSYEANYGFARKWYPDIRDKIGPGLNSPNEPYAKWGRNNPQYFGEYPLDTVTVRNYWLRHAAFETLEKDKADKLKKKFPNGAKTVFVDREFAEAVDENLDDHWTLTHNPLSDYLSFDPIGLLLTSIQEITNDLVSLTLQTIEHGIPQTFADPKVLNFDAYRQMETTPGAIYPTNQIGASKSIKDGFYEVKTATLSAEVLPFGDRIQGYGQLVVGAQPALFGGALENAKTASEYSMSRNQALQRLGTTWKMFTIWWKNIYGKTIPAYIKTVKDDQRFVKKDNFGGFVNEFIRKAELEGKIGSVELETDENLPMSWAQRRDVILKLMDSNNPQILAMVAQPENLHLIWEAIGITDFYVPGEDDRQKQYDEIKQLLNSEPIPEPPSEEEALMAISSGQEPQPVERPSIEVDPLMDNHEIEFEICRKWAISEAGMLAKIENLPGYKNVLLHAIMHKQLILPPPMAPDGKGAAPLASPKQDKQAPIKEDKDVKVQT